MIHFNVPPYVGNEFTYMEDAVKNIKFVEMAFIQKMQ